jgi:hypothetical protein
LLKDFVLRLLLMAFLPIALSMSPSAQAQSTSRALPPEDLSIPAPAAQAPLNASTKAAKEIVSPAQEVHQLANFVKKASFAVPPEDVIRPREAIIRSEKEVPVTRKAILDLAVKQIDEDIEEPIFRQPRHNGNLDSEVRCVAQAVYHEARGESVKGQIAVADVVMNRVRSGKWGKSACSVVNAPYQFSNRWSWTSPRPGVAAWDRAIAIAHKAVDGFTGVSSRLLNFRASYMGAGGRNPVRIGNHIFW